MTEWIGKASEWSCQQACAYVTGSVKKEEGEWEAWGESTEATVMSISMNGISLRIDVNCENITMLCVMHESAHSFLKKKTSEKINVWEKICLVYG